MNSRQITRLFLGFFLITVILTGLATYAVTDFTITRLVDQRIATISEVVVGDGDAQPGSVTVMLERIARFTRQRDTGDIGFLLQSSTGRVLGGNVALARTLPTGFSTLRAGDGLAGLTHGRALVRRVGGGMILVTIAETEPVDHYKAARLRIYLVGFGSIVVIVFGGVALFEAVTARRIAAMRGTAEAVIAGDLTRRVPVSCSELQ